jgi:hypothetical protein
MKVVPLVNHPSGLSQVKFGRRRPSPNSVHGCKLRFGAYAMASLPTPPASLDLTGGPNSLVPSQDLLAALRLVLLNDQLGDCTCAGAGHTQALLTGNAGSVATPTSGQVLALYEAVSGYQPGSPSTDTGADENTVLEYLCSNGFPDGTKLSSYLALDATNATQVKQAAFLFENLYFGIELPDAWVSPFPSSDGFVWDVGQPDPDNGHCVVSVGYNDQGVQIDTWGLFGTITWAAVAQLCGTNGGGQLFTLLSPDQIAKGQTKSPTGFDWATLQADIKALDGRGGLI